MMVRKTTSDSEAPNTRHHEGAIDERLGTMIIEGQRHELWVRSQPDDDGTWHNIVLFRRDGLLSPPNALRVGVDWHLPPGLALDRARSLGEKERVELFHRALRPRPPLV